MSELGSQVNELNDIQKQKEALLKWIEHTENTVAEYLQRPSKYRADAAQMEINMITDMQQTILEKQALLDHISQRESSIMNTLEYDIKIALETLDGHVSIPNTLVF